jgi:hypothetical protein
VIQNISGLAQGPARHSAAGLCHQPIRLPEEDAMNWSDSPWVLVYSILVTFLVVSWAYVPA